MVIPFYGYKKGTIDFRTVPSASLNAVMFGVPSFFVPRWQQTLAKGPFDGVSLLEPPSEWTYFYDHSQLANTLEKYVDYNKLSRKARKANGDNNNPRLIVTAVNILTAEALIFDSAKIDIKPEHILASCAYSAYGFPWVEVDENVYAWDGSLLSNTPLKEIVEASPRNDKNVFIIENYPRRIDRMPANWSEVVDRTRDIMFSDKTIYDLRAWRHMSRQTELVEMLYDMFEKRVDKQSLDPSLVDKIRSDYDNLVGKYGAEILAIHRIVRSRMESPHILKNADFSVKTVMELIRQGEDKTIEHLRGPEDVELDELLKLLYL
jgi:NTE family protein